MNSMGDLNKMYGENLNSKNQKEAKYVTDQQQLNQFVLLWITFFALYFRNYYLIGLRVSRSITCKFTAISSSSAICGSISSPLMTFVNEWLHLERLTLFHQFVYFYGNTIFLQLYNNSWFVDSSFALLFWLSKLQNLYVNF